MAFSTHDIVPDSPTNNFATLNPLNKSSSITLSNGNLKVSGSGASWDHCISNFFVPNGKFYFEVHLNGTPSGTSGYVIGLCNNLFSLTQTITTGTPDITNFVGRQDTALFNHSSLNNSFFNAMSADSIMRVYYDGTNASSKKIWFSSTSVAGDEIIIDSGITGDLFILIGVYGSSITPILNVGQDPTFGGSKSPSTTYTDDNGIGAFYYQPPTGALALCTANLPEMTPDVTGDVPADYFKAVLYTGNGSTQSITGVGFQPDLVWIKTRSTTANHALFDSIRGVGNVLQPNTTLDAQTDNATLTSFDSNGFSLGNATGSYVTNTSTYTFVAWCMKAGGAPTADNTATSGAMNANGSAATSSNSSVSLNGTLQSNYTPAGSPTIYPKRMSINTDAGFSIVKYTGTGANATVPHGLSSAPEMIIGKSLGTTARSWNVYHVSTGNTGILQLDATNEFYANSVYWQDTSPTSTVFSIGTQSEMNSTENIIAYCWHSVENYSKFGSYTGNGSADGPFVYCGFRPAWVMIKSATQGLSYHNWYVHDSTRGPYNGSLPGFSANLANQEFSFSGADFLSNGFKIRANGGEYNQSGQTYIFMAFAEQPFKFSNAR
jgi:hypothetical protein